ncbi:copper-binding protein [Pseudomonas sp. UBA2684]|uniref:copper-binding protein n=1 Tax=Pseudomonas sp. UBA2684 TaxID=1947311 RepID=UPI000E8368AF|nr:copper-binding protein [Pseudomonas sp. UBA2684]HBX55419.1 RND transporter [Pseudomonas sp.]|tara:strand:- start:10052 stop:10375 length:324 start_codon:yes stop_codon:yes gene_type:complete
MKKLLITALLGSTLAFPAFATQHDAPASGTEVSAALSQGEVRKIDLATQKITLRHGPIQSIGMPPMSMVFTVRDAALLEGLKVGDKVRFQAAKQGSQFVVTELQAAP